MTGNLLFLVLFLVNRGDMKARMSTLIICFTLESYRRVATDSEVIAELNRRHWHVQLKKTPVQGRAFYCPFRI